MKNISQKLNGFIYSEHLAFDEKMNNFVGLCGIIAALLTALVYAIAGRSATLVAVVASGGIIVACALYVSNRYGVHKLVTILDLIFIGDIFFPLVFIFAGGIDGPAPVYFVLSITLIFLLTSGTKKLMGILLFANVFVIISCFVIAGLGLPQLTAMPYKAQNVDYYAAIFISGLMLGAVVLYQHKLFRDEQKKVSAANEMMRKQDLLLHGVNEVAAVLFTADGDTFFQTLSKGVQILADCIEADRAILWRVDGSGSVNSYHEVCEWDNTQGLIMGAALEGRTYRREGFLARWEDVIRAREFLILDEREASDQERAFLSSQGVKALLVLPLYLSGEFWGLISFSSLNKVRAFTRDEVDIVHSGGLIIVNAFNRDAIMRDLVEAREKALAGTRAKTDFLSNMSHEIRTPMNAIIGMTTIAKNTDDIQRKQYCLGKIEEASTHLLGLINDVLDMSKIEANKFELSMTEFSFEKLLKRAVTVSSYRIDAKEQKLTIHLDKEMPTLLYGDDQRILQVITNLLSNAVKFTPEKGSIHIDARLLSRQENDCVIRVSVKDSGIGISEEQQKKLFSSFQQADSSTSRKFGGTGLGLAISKSIVEMMNGHIWVESELGKGAAFIFDVEVTRVENAKKNMLPKGVNWHNISILAVDDDAEMRSILSDITSRLGVSIKIVESGEQVCSLLDAGQHFDVFFIDWLMPEMNGIELAKRIKDARPEAVVIMITANHWMEIEQEAKAAGVDLFLSKPLFSSDIVDSINVCIGVEQLPAKKEIDIKDCFKGHCIMIAEDVEVNREIVNALLEPTGIEIDFAENGLIALNKFQENPYRYEMILMDVQMPEMDGMEATRKIRALDIDRAGEIPIVALTANVFNEDIERCMAAGMNSHMGKPLDFDNVMVELRGYLTNPE